MPFYLKISKGGCVLHLSEPHGDCSPGAVMRIETDELDAFHQRLLAKNYKHARSGIKDTPWDSRDMSIRDPFGNRLTLTNSISAWPRLTALYKPGKSHTGAR